LSANPGPHSVVCVQSGLLLLGRELTTDLITLLFCQFDETPPFAGILALAGVPGTLAAALPLAGIDAYAVPYRLLRADRADGCHKEQCGCQRGKARSAVISLEAHTQPYCVGALAGTAGLVGSCSGTTGVWGMYLDAQASITRAA
jgi:hypothetical protein